MSTLKHLELNTLASPPGCAPKSMNMTAPIIDKRIAPRHPAKQLTPKLAWACPNVRLVNNTPPQPP
eukprot:7383194-Prymnesium_polylepis.1